MVAAESEGIAGPGEDERGCDAGTGDVYCGYRRGRFSSRQDVAKDEIRFYTFPPERQEGVVYLDGPWICREEFLERPSGTGVRSSVAVYYAAAQANAVMAPGAGGASGVSVLRDGYQVAERIRGRDLMVPGRFTIAELDRLRLYNLVTDRRCHEHELRLETDDPGVRVYSFAFTNPRPGTASIP